MSKEDVEFNRLKQQILVIKNAYQEEKKKNDQLKNDLNNRDKEIESVKKENKELSNQNVNLTKELNNLIKLKNNETINRLNKMAVKDQNSYTHEDFVVLNNELSNKAQEMSRLHQQKEEHELAITLQISEFEQEILRLKELNDDKLNIANEELKSSLQENLKLQEEKEALEAKVIELFAELQNSKLDLNKKIAVEMFSGDNSECEDCKNKLLSAIEKMHESESKAFSYEIECRSLQKRLELSKWKVDELERIIREECRSQKEQQKQQQKQSPSDSNGDYKDDDQSNLNQIEMARNSGFKSLFKKIKDVL